MDGWLCQCVNLYKDQKLASESLKILSWVIMRLEWENPNWGISEACGASLLE